MSTLSFEAFPLIEQQAVMWAVQQAGFDLSDLQISKATFAPSSGGVNGLVTVVVGKWSRSYPLKRGRNWADALASDLEWIAVAHKVSPGLRPRRRRSRRDLELAAQP